MGRPKFEPGAIDSDDLQQPPIKGLTVQPDSRLAGLDRREFHLREQSA
jgi:hypothetical protein